MVQNVKDNRIPRKLDSILESDLGEEKVMMCIEKGHYFGLSKIGSRIFELVDGEISVDAICEQLESEFDSDGHDLRADVHAFLDKLVEFELLTW